MNKGKQNSTSDFYNDPLVSSFFENHENQELLTRKIRNYDKEASAKLDKRFGQFHLKVRLISYTDKLARYYSKEFDRKTRINQNQLYLDKPIRLGEETALTVTQIQTKEPSLDDVTASSIPDLLPSSQMKEVYNTLSHEKKQFYTNLLLIISTTKKSRQN